MDSIVEQTTGEGAHAAPGDPAPAPGDGDGLADVVAEPPTPPAGPTWLRRQLQLLVLLDAVAVAAATLSAKLLSIGPGPEHLTVRGTEIPYNALTLLTVPTWLVVLGMSRSYDIGPFGAGHREMRRVVSAAAHFLALIAVAYYVVHLERLGRGFLIVIVPLAAGFTLLGRFAARGWLQVQRSRGEAMRRAVVLGPRRQVRLLADHLLTHPGAGVVPVAALVPGDSVELPTGDGHLPVAGTPDDVLGALGGVNADLLLITGSLAPGELRKLTWQLEGSGVDVLVAPTVGRITRPQLDVRPVAGLPLLYVDRAELAAPRDRRA
ncbi:MAG TPA: hypothetical protein VIL36_11610 [Acidimicrobiales bacterium]